MQTPKTINLPTILIFLFLGFGFGFNANSQCPQLLDGGLDFSDEPYWIHCSSSDYSLTLQVNQFVGDYVVDWGDGSPIENGSGLDVGSIFVNHTYTSTVDTFVVTFIPDPSAFPGCTITGVVVMEEKATAEIGIPGGIDLSICVPGTFTYVNNTNQTSGKPISETTVFSWDYGDSSPLDIYDHTNAGQQVSHEYLPQNGGCGIVVSLMAENYCGATISTFGPISTWDVDTAIITPSALLLCYPDTTFTFLNTTDMNCQPDNSAQRYEFWNFGDYWGLGYDSIIDWQPWPPTAPQIIGYPGPGTYSVLLLDSSFCGIDSAIIDVIITEAPKVDVSVFPDTICMGEEAQFNGSILANVPDVFSWNFDDGSGWQGLGPGSQNHVYISDGDFLISFVGSVSGAGSICTDTANVPLHVRPAPIPDFILSDDEACDSLTLSIVENSTGGAVSWIWDFGNGQTSTDQNPADQSYTNPGTYTIQLATGSTNGCVSFIEKMVNIWETPVAGFSTSNACEGAPTLFSDESTAPINDTLVFWDWDFGDGGSSNDQNPIHVFGLLGIYPVELIIQTAHCADTLNVPVIVEPKPIMGFIPSPSDGCSPLSVNFTNTTTGADSYTWEFGDGFGSNDQSPQHDYFNFTFSDTVFAVELVAATAFGCTDTLIDSVDVYSGALADYTFSTVPNCAPAEIEFTNASINATSYEWDFGDGSPVSNAANPIHTFENTTVFIEEFTVRLVAFSANGCSDTLFRTISVNPEMILSVDLEPDSGCHPYSKQFLPTDGDGAVAWFWDFGDGHSSILNGPTHIYQNASSSDQTYDVTLIATNAFGCKDTSSSTITVFPKPNSNFLSNPLFGCAPLKVTFENQSPTPLYSIWNFGDGSPIDTNSSTFVSHDFDNTTAIPITYSISLITVSDDLCSDTSTHNLEVYPRVNAAFEVDTAGCSPLNLVFLNQSTGANDFVWDYGDGSNTENTLNGEHEYINTSFTTDENHLAILYAVSEFNCRDTAIQGITVLHNPSANASANVNSGCSPLEVLLENQSIGETDFVWSYGDQTTDSITAATFHSHTYFNALGTSITFETILRATSANGCTDTSTLAISVSPQVNASFIPPNPSCSPAQVQFVNTSTGATSFLWDFGEGFASTDINPIEVFTNTGINDSLYQITLIAIQDDCADTMIQQITVHPEPVVQFQIDAITQCYPVTVQFHNLTFGAESYAWDYGDGANSSNADTFHEHTFTNETNIPQDVAISLTGSNSFGCENQVMLPFTVLPQLQVDVNFDTLSCNPLQIVVQNQSVGVLLHRWNFGDGIQDFTATPSHIYNQAQTEDKTYQLTYIAQGYESCIDTLVQTMYEFQVPQALFSATPTVQTFPDATLSIQNLSQHDQVDYLWDFGDDSTSTDPGVSTHTYSNYGTYTIRLYLNNKGCSSNYDQTVAILAPPPEAAFSGMENGCEPHTVQFSNESLFAESYAWDFGDGEQSTAENPIHTYNSPGKYTLTLTAIGAGGQNTVVFYDTLEVYTRASAYFTLSKEEVFIPNDPLTCFNLSQNATIFQWSFGDGGTSTEMNPIHYYSEEGEFAITLIADNVNNCPDTFELNPTVLASASGEIVFPNAFTPNVYGSNGGVYDPNDITRDLNDVFHPVYSGIKEYQLWIFNRWGELIFTTTDLLIGWDGYYKGVLSQQDVYVWKVRAVTIDGKVIQDAGDVTLIR
jgi:PKD repeat protein